MSLRPILTLVAIFFVNACSSSGGDGAPGVQANRAPSASNLLVATEPNTPLNSALLASDLDNDVLTYNIVGMPTSGVVVLSGTGGQTFEYTPNVAYVGADSFTYDVSDGVLNSNTATVTINVNSRPVATGGSYTTSNIAPVSGVVTANDAEGDAVTFSVASQPAKGTVAIVAASGAFTYTPDPTADGADSFSVTASDSFQDSVPVAVDVEIFDWAGTQQFGSTEFDFTTTGGIYLTADRSIIFGGLTDGQIANTPPAGDRDGWLRKTDRRGINTWTVQFGTADDENARIIQPAPDGSGTFVIVPRNIADGATLYKFDDAGNQILNVPVDMLGVSVSVPAYWGGVDANGDIYVLSWITPQSSLMTKVDGATGATLWQLPFVGTFNNAVNPFDSEWEIIRFRSIDFDAAGNSIVSGWFTTDPAAPARPCSTCAFVASHDPDGVLLWVREITDFAGACSGPGESVPYRVTVAPDQSLWAVGHGLTSSADVPFGQVSKYNADATQLTWSDCHVAGVAGSAYYNFTPVHIAANGDGLILSEVQAAPEPISGDVESSELIVSRLDPNGNVVFRTTMSAQKLDGSLALLSPGDLAEDPQGVLFVGASSDGELVPGAGTTSQDVVLIRLDANGVIQ